ILTLRIRAIRALGIAILRVRLPLTIPVPVIIATIRVRVTIIVAMMTVMMMIGKGSRCGQQDAAPEEQDKERFLEDSCHTIVLSVICLPLTNIVPRLSSGCPAPQKATHIRSLPNLRSVQAPRQARPLSTWF